MPEHTAAILLAFFLAVCFYPRPIRDGRLFRIALGVFLATLALPVLAGLLEAVGIWAGRMVVLRDAGLFATVVLVLMSCLRTVRYDSEHLRCPDCGYILKGLAEPRCPECGRQI